jgi:hypothetical protein
MERELFDDLPAHVSTFHPYSLPKDAYTSPRFPMNVPSDTTIPPWAYLDVGVGFILFLALFLTDTNV